MCQQAILIFSNLGSRTNLLLLLKLVFNPSVTNTCKLEVSQWAHGSLVVHVHGPPHSSRPPKCGGWEGCVYLHENTSNSLLSRIQWASSQHENSPLFSSYYSRFAMVCVSRISEGGIKLTRVIGPVSTFSKYRVKVRGNYCV